MMRPSSAYQLIPFEVKLDFQYSKSRLATFWKRFELKAELSLFYFELILDLKNFLILDSLRSSQQLVFNYSNFLIGYENIRSYLLMAESGLVFFIFLPSRIVIVYIGVATWIWELFFFTSHKRKGYCIYPSSSFFSSRDCRSYAQDDNNKIPRIYSPNSKP